MSNQARVITLTPAPAIDRTYLLDALHPGEVHRAREVHAELAGKGVNVSTNLRRAGMDSLAVIPLSLEDSANLDAQFIQTYPVSARLRINITLLEEGGRTTKINEGSAALTPHEWEGLIDSTLALARDNEAPWILVAGTIPSSGQGYPLDVERLFDSAHAEKRLVALDTSGAPLLHLARTGLPDLIKPNAPELAECVGRPLLTLGDVVEAAQEVHQWGVTHVLVSLGPDGMVGVSSAGVVHASTGPVTVRNTIGAGDASVAGFLSHCVDHPEEFPQAVARGVAWGALKVQEVSSQLHSVEGLPDVMLTDSPEHDRVLIEPGVI